MYYLSDYNHNMRKIREGNCVRQTIAAPIDMCEVQIGRAGLRMVASKIPFSAQNPTPLILATLHSIHNLAKMYSKGAVYYRH